MISYSNPSGYTFYGPNETLPYDTNYILGVPMHSDSELGFYTLTITGHGYKSGSWIWSASNVTLFIVTGKNIHTKLNSVQTGIEEVQTNLTTLNSTILNNLTGLDDTLLSHFNSTLTSQIQNLTIKLTNEIISMNSSLSAHLTSEHQTLRNWFELVITELNSNISLMNPTSLLGDIDDIDYYVDFLMLESHEFFHLYNVKRILPTEFVKIDYTKEVYTDLLWFFEGFTNYYGRKKKSDKH